MVEDLELDFKNVEQKPEEKELQKEKAAALESDIEAEEDEEDEEERKEEKQEAKASIGIIGSIITTAWNTIGTKKGYEPINERESEALKAAWNEVESKYIGDLESPELKAVLVTAVILAPKYFNKQNSDVKTSENI